MNKRIIISERGRGRGDPDQSRKGKILMNEGYSALFSARANWDSFSTLRRYLQLEQAPVFRPELTVSPVCANSGQLSAISCLGDKRRCHKPLRLFRLPCKSYCRHEVLGEEPPPGPLRGGRQKHPVGSSLNSSSHKVLKEDAAVHCQSEQDRDLCRLSH